MLRNAIQHFNEPGLTVKTYEQSTIQDIKHEAGNT